MVRRAEHLARLADLEATTLHVGEGVEGALVDDVAIDIDQGRARLARNDHVAIPDLVEHRLATMSVRCASFQSPSKRLSALLARLTPARETP